MTVAHRHVLRAVDVVGITVRIHDQIIDHHILGAFRNDGKMAAVQDLDPIQHHILAPNQCDGLIAIPSGAMAGVGTVLRVGGICAGQHIDERTGIVHIAAIDQAFAIDHDIVLVCRIEQAVGEIGMAVILQTGIEVHFRLVVIAALTDHRLVSIPVIHIGACRTDDRIRVEPEVYSALEPDGVGLEIALRNHHGTAARIAGGLDRTVDRLCVLHRIAARHSPEIRDDIQTALIQQNAFVHGASRCTRDLGAANDAVLLIRLFRKGRQTHRRHCCCHRTDLQKITTRNFLRDHFQSPPYSFAISVCHKIFSYGLFHGGLIVSQRIFARNAFTKMSCFLKKCEFFFC